MAVKQKVKIKTFTGSGSFDVRDEMLKDSKDLGLYNSNILFFISYFLTSFSIGYI